MVLKAEVLIRNRNTGVETVLVTDIEPAQALKWVEMSMKGMNFNDMPEYVIRPIITKDAPVRRETKYADMENKVKVQKPQNRG